jgi:ABC-2 type transport system ATP-binding protein
LDTVPPALAPYRLELTGGGRELVYTYDAKGEADGIASLFGDISAAGIAFTDLHTDQSSLEEIFVNLLRDGR